MSEPRSLSAIAEDIKRDWPKPYFGAVPYIDALSRMNRIEDNYGYDSGREIVLRFLGNARNWRGETAQRVKAELNRMLGRK